MCCAWGLKHWHFFPFDFRPEVCEVSLKRMRQYGAWQSWSQWSSCTTTCGSTGYHIRRRACIPENDCSGSNFDLKPCDLLQQCEGEKLDSKQCLKLVLPHVLQFTHCWCVDVRNTRLHDGRGVISQGFSWFQGKVKSRFREIHIRSAKKTCRFVKKSCQKVFFLALDCTNLIYRLKTCPGGQ